MHDELSNAGPAAVSGTPSAGGAGPTVSPLRFAGYHQPIDRPAETEISEVGRGTPGGEYLRRFWHPIIMSSQIGERPQAIRILGEDLVIYRDLSGDIGLLHKHCAHRGASLEFGIIAEHGIRCCYHGWMFGNDGTILETPGEPASSPHKDKFCQGAYPTVEYKGLVFAYFGPQALTPAFPILDTMDMSDNDMVPYLIHSPCNWVQVSENSMDPFHVSFLHTRVAGAQFSEVFAELPLIAYHPSKHGFFYTNARRVGEFIWVRVHDHFPPNFSQNGAIFESVEKVRYFGRPGLTRWIVPVDDTNTLVIAWRHFNDRDDPHHQGKPENVGLEKTDFYGQSRHRSLEERQRSPGDYDAWTSQGPITSHAREHLATTDKGVAMLRTRLREEIRNLANGIEPPQWQPSAAGHVPTYAGDTILRIPHTSGDDTQLIRDVSQKIADAYIQTEHLPDEARRAEIAQRLASLNVGDVGVLNPAHGKVFEFRPIE
ncbi:aromatic ring-hydroxylating dioxygenase subunit alpha [Caballeronia sp. dw_19]|uniref:aromatic ring-hydroxylating dioxygenase subunit alpha n=1 Tax=Caballeronia sp. dw_19 TaxID=2719791 RepID=UPI001BD5B642|nr:aromatic ring-hydroxylating dioxygenase subunit alpha [Caballeronia sp. dw_19]